MFKDPGMRENLAPLANRKRVSPPGTHSPEWGSGLAIGPAKWAPASKGLKKYDEEFRLHTQGKEGTTEVLERP